MKLNIFCTAIKYYKVIDKLPKYIIPLGLGEEHYPSSWLNEKKGDNICSLNKYYGEATGIYWVWKNYLKNLKKDDWIGFCQYRRLWLNSYYDKKQKYNFSNLYSNLLKDSNILLNSSETILLQPTIFKNENLLEQFDKIYGENLILNCLNFLPNKDKNDFINFLKGNRLSICNMFITKPHIYKQYCNDMFNWIEKCFNYCKEKNLLTGHNIRLPIFMVERYTSFWFEKYSKCNYLSFAKLGKFFLSNKINKLINPLKLPFSFRTYPTIHKF